MRRWVMLLAAALLLTAGCARADTPQELRAQAREPWQETILAYGREIVLDVTAQMPDAEQVNVYRVRTISGNGDEGDSPYYEQLPKRRGYAVRRRPEEPVPAAQIDRELHAYGSPVSAGEALDAVNAFLASLDVQGVSLDVQTMTVRSPCFLYDKRTGEWGNAVYDGEVGVYMFDVACTLDGVPVELSPFTWRDSRNDAFGEPEPVLPWYNLFMNVGGTYRWLRASVPSVVEVTARDVALCPLDDVRAQLRALAQEGLLRDVTGMRLSYVSFGYAQEREVCELRPVWVCPSEIYYNETSGPEDTGYEPWIQDVLIDAQTGEILQLRWAGDAQGE